MIPQNTWSNLPFFQADWPALEHKLSAEAEHVYPPAPLRFRALDLCPPEAVRVVILGQDPYHTPGKADGLAFSIPQGFGGRLAALGNIFKELETDIGGLRTRTDLSDWAQQGVLLLNTALSVAEGQAKSHAKIGWTTLVSQILSQTQQRPTAYLLWGRDAQKYAPNGSEHLVLPHTHPSPLSAHRGFFGSQPFSTINEWLTNRGDAAIDWVGQG